MASKIHKYLLVLLLTPIISTSKIYQRCSNQNGYLSKTKSELTSTSMLQCTHKCSTKTGCRSISFNKKQRICKLHDGRLKDDGTLLVLNENWICYEDEFEASKYPLGTRENPLNNCRQLIKENQNSGYYWFKFNSEIFESFCDMTVDGGGWLQVAGYSVNPNYPQISRWAESYGLFPFLTDQVTGLNKIKTNHDVALTATLVKDLKESTNASQLRFFCSSGKTVHVATKKDSLGLAVFEYLTDLQKTDRPLACNSYYTLPGENSNLMSKCSSWRDGRWGHTSSYKNTEYRLYNYVAYVPGKEHIIANVLCDDQTGQNVQVNKKWAVFIR